MDKIEPVVEKKATTPWKPSPLLECKPIPGYRLRWCRLNTLEKSKAEGWIPVEAKDYLERTIIDGSQLGTYVTKRNLLLCKMPEAMAKSRDAYFAAKSKDALAETRRKFEDSGEKGLSYHEFQDESNS